METEITPTVYAVRQPAPFRRRILNMLDQTSQIVVTEWLVRSPHLKNAVTRFEYDLVSAFDRDGEILGLNYGYDLTPPLALPAELESNRFPLQLYHYVASAVDWRGRAALEIGSGRGGGAAYLMRQFQPATLTGLDLSPRAVAFSRRRFAGVTGLSFQTGNAEDLPFPDQSFDIVVNIESSLHYARNERFFAETRRVLKPGGHFLYADLRFPADVDAWREQIAASGLEMVSEANITAGVLRGLDLDRERRRGLIERLVPAALRFPFMVLAGLDGMPQLGQRVYLAFVLRRG